MPSKIAGRYGVLACGGIYVRVSCCSLSSRRKEKTVNTLLKTMTLLALAAFISSPVMAQSQNAPAKSSLGVPEAPVGHRQPTASDIPEQRTSADEMLDKINRDLDKKLKSICRGC